jgi:hypothetical protein
VGSGRIENVRTPPMLIRSNMALIIAATIVTLATIPARAAVDGGLLVKACKQNDAKTGFCIGFIAGVLDTIDAQNPGCNTRRGNQLDARQVINIVRTKLDTTPGSPVLLGAAVVAAAFPCE